MLLTSFIRKKNGTPNVENISCNKVTWSLINAETGNLWKDYIRSKLATSKETAIYPDHKPAFLSTFHSYPVLNDIINATKLLWEIDLIHCSCTTTTVQFCSISSIQFLKELSERYSAEARTFILDHKYYCGLTQTDSHAGRVFQGTSCQKLAHN